MKRFSFINTSECSKNISITIYALLLNFWICRFTLFFSPSAPRIFTFATPPHPTSPRGFSSIFDCDLSVCVFRSAYFLTFTLQPDREPSDCFGSWPDCPITCLWADNLSRLFPLRKRLPTFHRSATEISSGMWPTGIFTRLHVWRYTNLTKGSLLKEKSISCKTLALHFFHVCSFWNRLLSLWRLNVPIMAFNFVKHQASVSLLRLYCTRNLSSKLPLCPDPIQKKIQTNFHDISGWLFFPFWEFAGKLWGLS